MPAQEEKSIKSNTVCPKCGGKTEVKLVFSSQFCGVRAVASCKNGCQFTNQEQQELNMQASDELFE